MNDEEDAAKEEEHVVPCFAVPRFCCTRMNCPEVTNTELCPMNRDLSGEKHKVNPPGSTRISDGRNLLGPGESPGDKEFGPDFIVAVKVESEFPNEYSSLGKDSIVKVKVESEFEDDPTSQAKGEAEVVKSETFQNNLLQTSQDALSYNHVKQELCDSPPTEPSKTVQLIEDFVAAVKVESTFLDQSSSFHKGLNNDSICQLKFLIDLEKTSH
uniref:uncharacterized protein isoform X1 n=1 Tax=Myxine glutinosa TaxID=7769 RepID=UPI00358F5857